MSLEGRSVAAAHSHTQEHTHTHCGKFCSWCLLAYDCRKNKLWFKLSDLRDEAVSIPSSSGSTDKSPVGWAPFQDDRDSSFL